MQSTYKLLCQYNYDALDRLVNQQQSAALTHQHFYCKSHLATETHGTLGHTIIQHDDLLLAEQRREGSSTETTLLATDLQRSVLNTLKQGAAPNPIAYSPYGHRPALGGLLSLLGFNGERPDPLTGYYLLGNGYRAFNPVLMRFNSPDSLSPFGKGGLNSYTYCMGDPVNMSDPTGHFGAHLSPWQIIRLQAISDKSRGIALHVSGPPRIVRSVNTKIVKTQLSDGSRKIETFYEAMNGKPTPVKVEHLADGTKPKIIHRLDYGYEFTETKTPALTLESLAYSKTPLETLDSLSPHTHSRLNPKYISHKTDPKPSNDYPWRHGETYDLNILPDYLKYEDFKISKHRIRQT